MMGISDAYIGGYHPLMMATVYAMLVFPVAMRGVLRHRIRRTPGEHKPFVPAVAVLLICTLTASLLFFVSTNFAVWLWSAHYEHSLGGLTICYVQALPFFRFTFLGDMMFMAALFGWFYYIVR